MNRCLICLKEIESQYRWCSLDCKRIFGKEYFGLQVGYRGIKEKNIKK